eukprot:1154595-Pelagomonas_calceolata.AAC.8
MPNLQCASIPLLLSTVVEQELGYFWLLVFQSTLLSKCYARNDFGSNSAECPGQMQGSMMG